ncbi:8233_t:CDS:2 [Scutellospora calospora]|uniref:8233_t:CDS:1 n=1 Tax=Scutellospora calospora TaxID=85575 RepID=A0ACA9KXR6_9GLOM|nr:8233_t:CDS:2 [Scutellospora calospora]
MSSILKPFRKVFETKIEKLARKCGTAPLSLPEILQDEYTARIILRAMKESPFSDDLVLIIKWDDRGFNDVPTVPGCQEIKKRSQSITNTQDNHSCQILDLSLEYSESQVTSLSIGGHTDKETLTHYETNDSVTTNITSPEQIEISEMAHSEKFEGIDGSAKCIDNSFNIKEVLQHLAQLCDKTIGAEDRASKANYEEIICWSLYGRDFEF